MFHVPEVWEVCKHSLDCMYIVDSVYIIKYSVYRSICVCVCVCVLKTTYLTLYQLVQPRVQLSFDSFISYVHAVFEAGKILIFLLSAESVFSCE